MSMKDIDHELENIVEDLYFTACLLDREKKYYDSAQLSELAEKVTEVRSRIRKRKS